MSNIWFNQMLFVLVVCFPWYYYEQIAQCPNIMILFAGIRACMEANCPVNEEPYEITLDNHGCSDGPKIGRLRASTNVNALLFA